jgi:hypothetical protein
MTGFAKLDQIVIGQSVYNVLNDVQKSNFKEVTINEDGWNYVNPTTVFTACMVVLDKRYIVCHYSYSDFYA